MDGALYIIPTLLSNDNIKNSILEYNIHIIKTIDFFYVENIKNARRFIKKICKDICINKLIFKKIDLYEKDYTLFNVFSNKKNIGVLSDAGIPSIADPGYFIIHKAHKFNKRVIPLVGPSSIILALMSSGFNCQSFSFNGYIPINKKQRYNKIKYFEKLSYTTKYPQIFIETPYRSDSLFEDLKKYLYSSTKLCIACNLTSFNEIIKTLYICEWRKLHITLGKNPTIFIISI